MELDVLISSSGFKHRAPTIEAHSADAITTLILSMCLRKTVLSIHDEVVDRSI